jgi:hypothetical protein
MISTTVHSAYWRGPSVPASAKRVSGVGDAWASAGRVRAHGRAVVVRMPLIERRDT